MNKREYCESRESVAYYSGLMREFCRVYWVKVRYYGIMELYAPNKSAIYSVLGKYHVLKIQEVEKMAFICILLFPLVVLAELLKINK